MIAALSCAFIAWNAPSALPALSLSLLFNYAVGAGMSRASGNARFRLFAAGVTANVAMLVLHKYALLPNADAGGGGEMHDVLLPLGLSFYTFTQIAFLRELLAGKIGFPGIPEYLACILFFPKFAAGPVTRPSAFLPQLERTSELRWTASLGFIATGLFKKVVLADTLAPFADGAFNAAETGAPLATHAAWHGLLAYSLQIYFDFSGYSDMAIGIGLLFGIALPLNFLSPYRSANIAEFWRRWHMSLSFFLRDYVYIPLGGSRKGRMRTALHLMIVMMLTGIWHGSGVTFLLWGVMHGMFLVIHRLWKDVPSMLPDVRTSARLNRGMSVLSTFLCVTLAWVPFRAGSLDGALRMYSTLFRLPDASFNADVVLFMLLTIGPGLAIVWLLPDSARWIGYDPAKPAALAPDRAVPHPFRRGLLYGGLAVAAVLLLSGTQPFVYQDF